MTLDLSDDYEVVDNLQTVTYYTKTAESTWTSSSISNVLKRVTTKVLNGAVRVTGATFHVWNSQTAVTPKANDKLTDSEGFTWVVQQVMVETLNSRFKLVCEIGK